MINQRISNNTINKNLYYLEYLSHALDVPQTYTKLRETRSNRKRRSLSIAQVARLLEVAEKRSSRDHAIIAIFVYAGLRKMELCRLNLNDMDLKKGLMMGMRVEEQHRRRQHYIAGIEAHPRAMAPGQALYRFSNVIYDLCRPEIQ